MLKNLPGFKNSKQISNSQTSGDLSFLAIELIIQKTQQKNGGNLGFMVFNFAQSNLSLIVFTIILNRHSNLKFNCKDECTTYAIITGKFKS